MASYEIKVKLILKAFEEKTHSEMKDIIHHALKASEHLREVMVFDYEGDTNPDL